MSGGSTSDDFPIGVGMGGSCPECRAPIGLGQEFCLECGAAITPRSRLSRWTPGKSKKPGAAGKKKFPWIPFLVVLGVIVAAGVVIWDLSGNTGGSDKVSTKSTETTSTDSTNTDGLTTLTTDTTSTPTAPTPTISDTSDTSTTDTTDTTTDTTDTSTDSWTLTTAGFTVIVSTFPKSSYSEADAEAKASEVRGTGLEAGVLDSDNYSSLTEGLWVVYSGQFTTEASADSHRSDVTAQGYTGAYVREVTA